MKTAKEICDLVNTYGVSGIHRMTENEVRESVCLLAKELKDTQERYLSATHLYSETDSKTEWSVWEKSTGMRYVWIVKRVTRMAGSDFEETEDSHVMLVDREIAPQMVELLNSQNQLRQSA